MLVTIQSSVPHSDLAIPTAMKQVGGSIAASIGSTMAGTIWNNMPSMFLSFGLESYDTDKNKDDGIAESVQSSDIEKTETYGVEDANSTADNRISRNRSH